MTVSSAHISLVVSTVGRSLELSRLMESLLEQEFKDFEIVVVDQNGDDRILPVLERYRSKLNINYIRTPERQGISAGRNDGWRNARGDIIVFPDDDCWYPRDFLLKGLTLLKTTGADLVTGRSTDETGRSINGRFCSHSRFITRRRVWMSQAEWITFYRREVLICLDGFDENLGIGGKSFWQAAEGPDLILRALRSSSVCYYDPSLQGFHQEHDLDDPKAGMIKKGRTYGRGMGYVLRQHRYGLPTLIYWAARPLATALTSAIRGRFHRAAYSLAVSTGRIEGWAGYVRQSGTPDPADREPKAEHSSGAPAGVSGGRDFEPLVSFAKRRREMTGRYRARNPLLIAALYSMDAFASLLPKRQKEIKEGRPLRILVANWGQLGDVVTILPLLKFLECNPRVQEVGVLIGSWSRSVLEASDLAAKIHVIDHWALDRSKKPTSRKIVQYLARYASLVRELSQCQYDMSIDTFASFPSSHGIMWSASIPRRVGFISGGLGPCLTDTFDWVPDDRPMLDHQLMLLKPLLGEKRPKALAASYPGFRLGIPEPLRNVGTSPYIVIHMGPQNIRGWVAEKWTALAIALKDQGYELVATGGPGEERAAQALSEKVAVRDVTGRLSWQQFVATIAGATAVVTIDSVAGHLAACFGLPTVVLAAGRQRISLWHPNDTNAIMLTHAVGCAPCNRSNGCGVMACVRMISVEQVLASVQQAMSASTKTQSLPSDMNQIDYSSLYPRKAADRQ
jgi:ADP-heptose:LPS heptosyltransferase/glycosyltransferase involved in cell wall biosynthesis